MKLDFDCIKEILQRAEEDHAAGSSPVHMFLNLTKPHDQKLAHHYKYLIEENLLEVEIEPIKEVEHENDLCGMIIGTARSLELEIIIGRMTIQGERLLNKLRTKA